MRFLKMQHKNGKTYYCHDVPRKIVRKGKLFLYRAVFEERTDGSDGPWVYVRDDALTPVAKVTAGAV